MTNQTRQEAFYLNQSIEERAGRTRNDLAAFPIRCIPCGGMGSFNFGSRPCSDCDSKGYVMVLNNEFSETFKGLVVPPTKEELKKKHVRITKKIINGRTYTIHSMAAGFLNAL